MIALNSDDPLVNKVEELLAKDCVCERVGDLTQWLIALEKRDPPPHSIIQRIEEALKQCREPKPPFWLSTFN